MLNLLYAQVVLLLTPSEALNQDIINLHHQKVQPDEHAYAKFSFTTSLMDL